MQQIIKLIKNYQNVLENKKLKSILFGILKSTNIVSVLFSNINLLQTKEIKNFAFIKSLSCQNLYCFYCEQD